MRYKPDDQAIIDKSQEDIDALTKSLIQKMQKSGFSQYEIHKAVLCDKDICAMQKSLCDFIATRPYTMSILPINETKD